MKNDLMRYPPRRLERFTKRNISFKKKLYLPDFHFLTNFYCKCSLIFYENSGFKCIIHDDSDAFPPREMREISNVKWRKGNLRRVEWPARAPVGSGTCSSEAPAGCRVTDSPWRTQLREARTT
ncbi:hypothetical protein EVAR_92545_1 [Eumeta japonica]|uniref:Uncharacterized protein n=1 Tax=Eumeta variegata TaxID=151549 RepID=A0A4C1SX91_EUMVA|nr:hypothetical protein EVAR_92545_1 [Eumeta japonica]